MTDTCAGVSTVIHGTLRAARNQPAVQLAHDDERGRARDPEPSSRPTSDFVFRPGRRGLDRRQLAGAILAATAARSAWRLISRACPWRSSAASADGLPPPFHWTARVEP